MGGLCSWALCSQPLFLRAGQLAQLEVSTLVLRLLAALMEWYRLGVVDREVSSFFACRPAGATGGEEMQHAACSAWCLVVWQAGGRLASPSTPFLPAGSASSATPLLCLSAFLPQGARGRRLAVSATNIQAAWRGMEARQLLRRARAAAVAIQASCAGTERWQRGAGLKH